MYPTIFTLGTANLGKHTRRGAGILVMGVAGGAVFPPIQGAVADNVSTRVSYIIPLFGFVVVLSYAVFHWLRNGRHILRVKDVPVLATKSSIQMSSEPFESNTATEKNTGITYTEHVA